MFHSPLSRWPPSTRSARVLPAAPAQHRTRRAPHGVCHLRRQRARGQRAAVDLADAPGRAGVELGQRLHGVKPRDRIDLLAAVDARQQQAEQPLLVQLLHHVGNELPQLFVGCARFFDERRRCGRCARPARQTSPMGRLRWWAYPYVVLLPRFALNRRRTITAGVRALHSMKPISRRPRRHGRTTYLLSTTGQFFWPLAMCPRTSFSQVRCTEAL